MGRNTGYGISKSEGTIIASLLVFGILYVTIALPTLTTSQWFSQQTPLIQYLIFNIGFIAVTAIVFGLPYAHVTSKKFDVFGVLKSGIATWIGFSLVLDLLQPPLYVSPMGKITMMDASGLPNTSIDATITYLWQTFANCPNTIINVFGQQVSTLFIAVYLVTPVLGAVVAAYLLEPKMFEQCIGLHKQKR
jgi:hypothetical protein